MAEPADQRRRHRVSQALMAIGVADCTGALTAVARVAAVLLTVLYVAVVAGNWSGYDGRQPFLVALLTAPLLVACVATVWATHSGPIRHKPGPGPHPVG